MLREYCPKCQTLQNMYVSTYERVDNDEKGQDIRITTKDYQCSVCHSFVKSEESKKTAGKIKHFSPCYAVRSSSNRPDFPNNMTDEERIIMQSHSEFWDKLLSSGKALVTGPVQDPNGTYGFAIVFADSEDAARELLKDDPALKLSVYHYSPMLASYVEK